MASGKSNCAADVVTRQLSSAAPPQKGDPCGGCAPGGFKAVLFTKRFASLGSLALSQPEEPLVLVGLTTPIGS